MRFLNKYLIYNYKYRFYTLLKLNNLSIQTWNNLNFSFQPAITLLFLIFAKFFFKSTYFFYLKNSQDLQFLSFFVISKILDLGLFDSQTSSIYLAKILSILSSLFFFLINLLTLFELTTFKLPPTLQYQIYPIMNIKFFRKKFYISLNYCKFSKTLENKFIEAYLQIIAF